MKFTVEVTPEPLRVTVCLVPATAPELSVIVSVAGPKLPTAVGANVTLIVHVPFAAIDNPFVHVVVFAIANKFAFVPVIATALVPANTNGAVPLFVNVTPSVAVWLIGWFPNGSVDATCATGAVPVPLNPTVCFVPAVPVAFPLSVRSTVAERPNTAVGLNATLNVQLVCPATVVDPVAEHGVVAPAVSTKSPGFPLGSRASAVIVSVASPLLLTVTVVAALDVPTSWLPKLTLAVDSVAVGAVCPVPLRVKVCAVPAVPPALSVKVNVADLAPLADGVNVSTTVQVLFGATELITAAFTQVVPAPLTMAKSPTFVPPNATVARVREAVPLLVKVTVC